MTRILCIILLYNVFLTHRSSQVEFNQLPLLDTFYVEWPPSETVEVGPTCCFRHTLRVIYLPSTQSGQVWWEEPCMFVSYILCMNVLIVPVCVWCTGAFTQPAGRQVRSCQCIPGIHCLRTNTLELQVRCHAQFLMWVLGNLNSVSHTCATLTLPTRQFPQHHLQTLLETYFNQTPSINSIPGDSHLHKTPRPTSSNGVTVSKKSIPPSLAPLSMH